MGRWFEKFRKDKSGESIAETLVALLIGVVSATALAAAIVSAAGMNLKTRNMNTEFVAATSPESEKMEICVRSADNVSGASAKEEDDAVTVTVDKFKTDDPKSFGPYVYYGDFSSPVPFSTVFIVYRVDGKVIEQIAVDEDGVPPQPSESPEKEGYVFSGWEKANGKLLIFDTTDPDYEPVTSTIEVNAKWSVAKPRIKVKAESKVGDDAWTYDGDTHTYEKFEITEGALIEGDSITVTVSGEIKNVGTSDNNVSEVKITRNGVDVTDEYEIVCINGEDGGKLEVKPREVTVTANNASKTYGESDPDFTGSIEGAVEGEENLISYTVTRANPDVKDAGTYKNELVAAGDEKQGNYVVSYVSGTFTINKRNVTLTSADNEKTYDGTALTDDTVTVSWDGEVGGFVTGEGADYDVTGSQTDAGESDNEFSYTLKDGTLAKNYNITPVYGTLTVNKADADIKDVTLESSVIYVNGTSTLTFKYKGDGSVTVTPSSNDGGTAAVSLSKGAADGEGYVTYTATVTGTKAGSVGFTISASSGTNYNAASVASENNPVLTVKNPGYTLYGIPTDAATGKPLSGVDTVSHNVTSGGTARITAPTAPEGYTFKGWATSATGTPSSTSTTYEKRNMTADVTVYAIYDNRYTIHVMNFGYTNSATVTVTLNGETVSASLNKEIENVPYGTPISIYVQTSNRYKNRYAVVKSNNSTSKEEGVLFSVKDGESGDTNSNNYTIETTTTMPAQEVWIGGYATDRNSVCIAEGTFITLADGSHKAVEDLTAEDLVLVFNHETGELDAAPMPLMVHNGESAETRRVMTLVFSDGTEIRVIGDHGFFDTDANEYVYISSENVEALIGHHFYKNSLKDGVFTAEKVALTGVRYSTEEVRYFAPISAYHLNYFANDFLSMTSLMTGYFNIFELDEDMKYDAEKMEADIEAYGLLSFEDYLPFIEAYGKNTGSVLGDLDEDVYRELYEYFPAKYFAVSVGKGIVTMDHIFDLAGEFFRKENILTSQ